MAYLERTLEQRLDPRKLLDDARTLIVVAMLYHQRSPPAGDGQRASSTSAHPNRPRGSVAMYAWGNDYHRVMKKKLFALADRLRERFGGFASRACVDTAPLLEREMAAAAGIGWIGKNTMVLHPELGSYFFIGALVTSLDLEPDDPIEDHCGSCSACVQACPTRAFPAPYEMDASRCISYLTIEHRGAIDPALHESMGDWIFGCDVCQQVCPFNNHAPTTSEPRFAIRTPGPTVDLEAIANWSDEDYTQALRGSAIKRAKLDMLKRNAAIARENVESNRRNPP